MDGKPITLLKKGSYFGELSLLRDMRRTASVRVVSETCDLFVLTKAGPAAATHAATSCAQNKLLKNVLVVDFRTKREMPSMGTSFYSLLGWDSHAEGLLAYSPELNARLLLVLLSCCCR